MHYCTSQPHCYALLQASPPLCTIAQASPTPMHYCTSQPHPYALLHKPAPPLCTIAQASPTLYTIAQASPTPMHYCTSQPHPYALLHKPAPPLRTIAQASPTPTQASPTPTQASPTPMHCCTSQPHPSYTSQPHPSYTSQLHPYALLHKPAPPLCSIAQAPMRIIELKGAKLQLGVNWDRSRLQGATEDRSNDCQVHGIVLRMNRPHFCSPHSEGFFRRIHGVGSSDTVWSV